MTEPINRTSRRCGVCRRAEKQRVRLPEYAVEYAHDDGVHTIRVSNFEVWQCTDPNCAAIRIDNEGSQILDAACREQLSLLQPKTIQEQREKLGLTRTELAKALRIDMYALSRCETGGQLQPGSVDRLLRLFFALPEVRREVGVEPGRVRVDVSPFQQTSPA